jgi:thiol-disulfide isomerase/thioredoxin
MAKMIRLRQIFFIILPLMVIICTDYHQGTAQSGKKAEDFVVYSVDGKRNIFYEMSNSLPTNGVIILNFSSIHCRPCRKEIPELVRIMKKSSGRARFICVYAEGGKEVKENALSIGILTMAYVDPFGNIRNQYAVKKIPVTIIISKEHRIVDRFEGYSEDNMQKIEKLVLAN